MKIFLKTHLTKIKSFLSIFQINSSSQLNKIKYEKYHTQTKISNFNIRKEILMKKSLQKYIAVLVFVIMICNIISPSYFINAEDNILDKLGFRRLGYINDWIIDIENKYIYMP
jgi:hypothetical protein